MMRKRLFATLASVVVLALVLVGCGGGAAAVDPKADFMGTWAIDSVTGSDGELTGDDLELYKAMGIYLTLDEEGKAVFEMFGIEIDGSWEATEVGKATLKFEGDEAEDADLEGEQVMTVADGKLSMEAEGEAMTFVQIDPSEKTSGDISSLLGDALDSIDLGDSDDSSPLTDSQALDITVADDDVCTIKVSEVGDYYGDPGYLVSVTNKTDGQILVDDNDEFSVNGTVLSPIFSMSVDAGETEDEILWFENSELDDGGVAALTNVTGQIIVTNAETGDILGTYDFAA